MSPLWTGVIIGLVIFLVLAAKRSGERTAQEAMKAAQEAAQVRAEAIEEDALPQVAKTTYKPKGKNMPKPVFLPSPADSLLEEDPEIAWQPVYMNPQTGELIEYGHK